MKNAFKFGFLGLALTLFVASCGGSESSTEETSDTTLEVIPTPDDTVAIETTITTDTISADTL